MKQKLLHVYLVSDSSGETVAAVSKAVIAQFDELKVIEYMWPLVRSVGQVDDVIKEIKLHHGIVIYTMLDIELRRYLKDQCRLINAPCISAIGRVISEISKFLGVTASTANIPGKYKNLDEQYYKRIEIINYTIQHDDGQHRAGYNEADILLLGVSRTSKSPTALYLAQRGYKTANLPIIKNVPVDLANITNPLIVGLTIAPEVLSQIRNNRLLALHAPDKQYFQYDENHYINIESVKEEIQYAKKIFEQYNIKMIDTSRRAVEETAAEIINMYFEKKGEHKMLL